MSRLVLAFLCFFRILFGKKLPPGAMRFLPEGTTAKSHPEPAVTAKPPRPEAAKPTSDGKEAKAEPDRPKVSTAQHHRDGALALLALLQREGRLVDFLREPLDGFSDADIGAAARDVHRGCRKVLDQHLSLEPVMPGEEEAKVVVPKGFDPAEIRLIGEAKGEPPLRGTLRHHGWRVVDAKLPALAEGVDRMVIAPAEVELSQDRRAARRSAEGAMTIRTVIPGNARTGSHRSTTSMGDPLARRRPGTQSFLLHPWVPALASLGRDDNHLERQKCQETNRSATSCRTPRCVTACTPSATSTIWNM